MEKGGNDFFLNGNILDIDSPKRDNGTGFVSGGPFDVIYKNTDITDKWAIVALKWKRDGNEKNCLGIRYFWDPLGYPNARGQYPQWFIIPKFLEIVVLNSLPLKSKNKKKTEDFLKGKDVFGTKEKWHTKLGKFFSK